MNDSSLLSNVKLRLGLCSIIKKLLKLVPLGMLIGGPPCSSWVFINRATSRRSTRRVFGNCALKYVRDANTTLVIHESQVSFQCLLHFGTCWSTNCLPSTPVVSQLDSCLCASTPAISHFCHYLLGAGFGCKDNHKMDIVGNASSSSVCAVAHGTATVVLDALLWIHAICSSYSATFALGFCLIVGCSVLCSYMKQIFRLYSFLVMALDMNLLVTCWSPTILILLNVSSESNGSAWSFLPEAYIMLWNCVAWHASVTWQS